MVYLSNRYKKQTTVFCLSMKWFLLFLKMYKIDSRCFLEAITYIEQTRSNPEEMGHTDFRSSTLQGLTQIYRTDQE